MAAKAEFGKTADGKTVTEYTLTNGKMKASGRMHHLRHVTRPPKKINADDRRGLKDLVSFWGTPLSTSMLVGHTPTN